MNPVWQSEVEVNISLAKRLIEKQFPTTTVTSISMAGEGFDNTVFQVNGDYVFRFPRRKVAVNLIETEGKLLPRLCEKLPLPVPRPMFYGIASADYPWPFLGYSFIRGRSPGLLTEQERYLSVERLATFLKSLHSFPVDEAIALGVKQDFLGRTNRSNRKGKLVAYVEEIVDKKLVTGKIMQKLTQFVDNVPETEHKTKASKKLVHGDLHIRNILVDNDRAICGVIDWGDTHIGNPAVDLSIVYSFFPPQSRNDFFRLYGEVDQETRDVARFVAIQIAVVLLLYGKDKGKDSLTAVAHESLRLALL